MKTTDIPIPECWPDLVRRAMIHASSLAHYAIIYTRSMAADSKLQRVRLAGKLDKARNEISLFQEELRIIKSRFSKIPARRRPYYSPFERMAILELKAVRGWNLKQTAHHFMVETETIAEWMRRSEDDSLIQIPVPVNKFPDFVRYIAKRMKTLCPRFGKRTIAEYFARSGLHLSATTISRYLRTASRKGIDPPPLQVSDFSPQPSIIISRHPNHTWMIDLTTVPTHSGFWTSWLPYALPQIWPFCWWVMIIIDHFSRKVVGFALFMKPPSAGEVIKVMNRAIRRTGRKPKYIISDKGSQFWPNGAKPENRKNHPYLAWCRKKKIKPRHGAVGKYGSIAIIERFMRSLKDECTRQILVPLNFNDMRHELALYIEWYNKYRPHYYLNGRTPQEVYNHSPPELLLQIKPNSELPEFGLNIAYLEGRKNLPVIEIKRAA